MAISDKNTRIVLLLINQSARDILFRAVRFFLNLSLLIRYILLNVTKKRKKKQNFAKIIRLDWLPRNGRGYDMCSTFCVVKQFFFKRFWIHFLPSHLVSATMNPEGQWHLYDPGVLMQSPSQPPLSVKHSFTSIHTHTQKVLNVFHN